jgi:hypothetical protein
MMRCLIAALMIVAALALAAGHADAGLTAKAGLSFASTSGSAYVPDPGKQTGFAAGLSFGLGLARIVELRPEALYVQKGGEWAPDQEFTINELDIPLLVQCNLPILGCFVYAGPQGEIELNVEAKGTDIADTDSFRWGGVAGIGFKVLRVASIEGRYNWTLDEISSDIQAKPRTILIMAGLGF